MNFFAGAGFVAMAAGLLYVFVDQKPADVYDMPVNQAYGLLTSVDFGESSGSVQRTSTGNGSNKVTWHTRGSHVGRSCELALAPFEGNAAQTHVTVTCQGGGAGEGAASGMAHNMHRDGVIERVDATLTGRAYDSARAGSTASRWPSDGVDGSYGTAVATAIEMDREVREMQAASRQARSPEAIHDAQMDAFYAGS